MIKENYSFQLSAREQKWLNQIQKYAICCPGSGKKDYKIFDPHQARLRDFIVMPFLGIWRMDHDPILTVAGKLGLNKLYATTFHDDIFGSVSGQATLDEDAVWKIVAPTEGNYLVVPRTEDFFVLHTQSDYWLVIGPPDLAMQLMDISIEKSFFNMRRLISQDNFWDPSDDYFKVMLELYERHNRKVMG